MASTLATNIMVFKSLLGRDLHILRSQLKSKLIDGAAIVVLQVLVFGHLLPLAGMPSELIGPTFIGTIVQLCFSLGYGLSLRLLFDIEHNRFISYRLTLPITKHWLFIVYIINFMIEVAVTTIPLFSLGIIALGSSFITVQPNIPLFVIVYFCVLFFMGTLFLSFSLMYPFRWFFDNLWPRRLTPLFLLSCSLFPWKRVFAISPTLGIVFLANPFTYVAEGLRATLLGGPDFLSAWLCIAMLALGIIGSWCLCNRGIQKRLDPV
jgi:ABC-2 type transport system permease protein